MPTTPSCQYNPLPPKKQQNGSHLLMLLLRMLRSPLLHLFGRLVVVVAFCLDLHHVYLLATVLSYTLNITKLGDWYREDLVCIQPPRYH